MVKRVRPPILVVALSLTVAATVMGGAVWAIRRNAAPLIATDLEHSARVVLVDPAAQIRAYAVATDADSMKMLLTNLRAVLSEAQQNRGGG